MAKFALPHLHMTRGVVIATGSEGGEVGEPTAAPYGGSKGFLHAMIPGIAYERGKYGVHANCVCPGPIDTAWTHKETGPMDEQMEKQTLAGSVLGRRGTPEEMANVFVFVASDEASYMTGALVFADGGATIAKAAREIRCRISSGAGRRRRSTCTTPATACRTSIAPTGCIKAFRQSPMTARTGAKAAMPCARHGTVTPTGPLPGRSRLVDRTVVICFANAGPIVPHLRRLRRRRRIVDQACAPRLLPRIHTSAGIWLVHRSVIVHLAIRRIVRTILGKRGGRSEAHAERQRRQPDGNSRASSFHDDSPS